MDKLMSEEKNIARIGAFKRTGYLLCLRPNEVEDVEVNLQRIQLPYEIPIQQIENTIAVNKDNTPAQDQQLAAEIIEDTYTDDNYFIGGGNEDDDIVEANVNNDGSDEGIASGFLC